MKMTEEERAAEDAATLAAALLKHPRQYRKKREGGDVSIDITGLGIVTITADDTTLMRLWAASQQSENTIGWRANNGTFTLTPTQALTLYQAGFQHVTKCFEAQAAIEGSTYTSIADIEAAFDAAYEG